MYHVGKNLQYLWSFNIQYLLLIWRWSVIIKITSIRLLYTQNVKMALKETVKLSVRDECWRVEICLCNSNADVQFPRNSMLSYLKFEWMKCSKKWKYTGFPQSKYNFVNGLTPLLKIICIYFNNVEQNIFVI